MDDVRVGKFLSLVLRHQPEVLGLVLDPEGYIEVDQLIRAVVRVKHWPFTRGDLDRIVDTNSKKRYSYNGDRTKIRASQGHSVEVELGYAPKEPPTLLYHGSAYKYLDSILKEGLVKKSRQHVHLSVDRDTAVTVGRRHGSPAVFTVKAGEMHRKGFLFYISDNGVWLTDSVPPDYLGLGT